MPSERLPVVVYGASGFTGRLVCAELVKRGATFVVAGRDRAKLEALAESLPQRPEHLMVARLDDPKALEAMAARGRVLLDCAGPFGRYGRPVLEAALAAGSHFLDITGEAPWLRECWQRSADAQSKGVAIVNSVGFDVVPTDCVAAIAAEDAGTPVESVRIAFAALGTRPTRGTTRSALDGLRHGGAAWVDGRIVRERVGKERWTVTFPPPIGPRETLSIPWGDVVTAPRSTGARNVRVFMRAPKALAKAGRVLPTLGKAIALPGLAWAAERCVRSLPEGPAPERRARAISAAYAEAVGKHGTGTAWALCGDGYDFTALSAAHCALLASAPGFGGKGGTLTPSQAFGAKALLDGLGLKWGRERP